MTGVASNVLNVRAASESVAHIGAVPRRDVDTFRLVTKTLNSSSSGRKDSKA
jgi:hypothetical protein